MRPLPSLYAGCTVFALATTAAPAGAADTGLTPPPEPEAACIETEVNGYRALSYGCLNQKMTPRRPPAKAPDAADSEAATQRPPNQIGLPTPATIGNRMGNTFGTSAYPQRPPPP